MNLGRNLLFFVVIIGKASTFNGIKLHELWDKGQKCKLYIYKSHDSIYDAFNESDLLLNLNVIYDVRNGKKDKNESKNKNKQGKSKSNNAGKEQKTNTFSTISPISIEELIGKDEMEIKMEKTLFAHVYLVKEGHVIDPSIDKNKFSIEAMTYKRIEIIYKNSNGKYCLYPYLDISFVSPPGDKGNGLKGWMGIGDNANANIINLQEIPWYTTRHLIATRERSHFYPIIYLNEFWRVKDREIELKTLLNKNNEKYKQFNQIQSLPNKDFSKINIYISVNDISWTYFTWTLHFDKVFEQLKSKERERGNVSFRSKIQTSPSSPPHSSSNSNNDEKKENFNNDFIAPTADGIKLIFLENSPFILVLTLIVSILHMIFEFLAFKNDIQFWRGKNGNGKGDNNDLKGLSMQSIILNTVGQLLIFLYLVNEGTNYVIQISVFMGFLIEMWKLTRIVKIRFNFPSFIWSFCAPISISLNGEYFQSETNKYDWIAMKYLGGFIVPIMLGYSWYSFDSRKSLYSGILSTLVGFVYAFGFIMMTPQLFINYKMKSVSHMPWRAFVYRALNTFIDDLFAFIIRMPMIHRIACLRDDVVFIVYLYQRWIYPISKKEEKEIETEKIKHSIGKRMEKTKNKIKIK